MAVIGAGWIGSEVAASARQMGAEVVLIAPTPVPLGHVLGDEIGEVFRRLHADNGVQLRLGVGVGELRGSGGVEEVVLTDGTTEPADLVVAGIGVTPRTDVAGAGCGLAVDNGVVADQHLETNVAAVYAAGDVANAWHPRYRRHVRVEHWANALNQGTTAGRNVAGWREVYDRLPYFFSDQYDLGMEYVGLSSSTDELVVRGDLDAREFVAFWHRDGVVSRGDERERLGRGRGPEGDHHRGSARRSRSPCGPEGRDRRRGRRHQPIALLTPGVTRRVLLQSARSTGTASGSQAA